MKQRARGRPARRPTPSPLKQARHEKVDAVKARAKELFGSEDATRTALLNEPVRGARGRRGPRPDPRHRASASTAATSTTVRPIEAVVGVLPRVHGSALFTRGETQALCVATLGTGQDEQMIDALEGDSARALHAALQLPALLGRRDRPHGLARAAARSATASSPGAPPGRCCRPRTQFPYTIRVVSEITESNGSSSMATVCGTSLALMDAGVPLPRRSPASPWA